ncbi:ABC-type oligopeptide transporter ABCB9-like isoform X1 [Mya arenaria]|uniref:ABC-type oligopeptide transporter ABCB9-like isoform X1 n=1 Tax=Mya arenaria TaxID=6604 RepID=UPI0022E79C37|nr:ABC-type oligopeptide transporter ABCB9-like isoform X1 [Mya arenaria]
MKRLMNLLIVFMISLIDLTVTTILYSHGNQFNNTFSYAFSMFSFSRSMFDVWSLVIVRTSVNIGIVIGAIWGKRDASAKIKSKLYFAIGLSIVFSIFTLVKLLCVSENETLTGDKWFWALFGWTLFADSCVIFQWRAVGNVKYDATHHTLLINADTDGSEDKHLQNDDNNDSGNGKEKAAPSKVKKGTVLRIIKFSMPDWPLIATGFVFLTISATGEIFIPFYTGRVVDGIVIDKSQTEFTHAIVIMALISAGSALAAGIRGLCLFIAVRKINIRIRNTLFTAILRQEIGFFDKVQTGDITSRLTSDTTTMSDALALNVNIFLRNFIKAGGVVFFMMKLSWQLTIVTLIGLPLIIGISNVYGKYYKVLAEKVQNSLAEANNVAEEACSTMRTVRSFANEMGEVQRYADKLAETFKLNMKQAFMYSGYTICSMWFELGLTVAVLYYGGHLVISGHLTGGTLISFILYQIQLGDCLNSMGFVYTGLMEAAGASEKVFEYIDRVPAIHDQGSKDQEPALHHQGDQRQQGKQSCDQSSPACVQVQGHIEFQDVCFTYPSRPDVQVLKNLSFSVCPGEVIALVGCSGGGKTSCVNLLEHFYEPDSGQVLLDGRPIHTYDHRFLHKQISLVGQEPVLYARTIEENIRYGLADHEWTMSSVQEAAEMANAHKFISELKDGYNTQAGEKGVQMSGGQKQRIAIARALLRKPRVLLLDEATSALDAESEFLVQQALYRNMAGRTVIVIAHRLSTVERADKIIVIDKGQVMEQGSHLELLQAKGMYANLVKRQLLLTDSSWSEELTQGRQPNIQGKELGNQGRELLTKGVNLSDNPVCISCGKSVNREVKPDLEEKSHFRLRYRDRFRNRDHMNFLFGSV